MQLGEDHEKTKESSEYLKCLTQQAVALQRTMNEIYRNGSSANIPPLKVGPPLNPGRAGCAPAQPSSVRGGSPFLRPSVHSPQHGQRLGTAERHQRHPLHSSQVRHPAPPESWPLVSWVF